MLKKYWLKNRIKLSLIYTVIFSSLITFGFMSSIIGSVSKEYNISSIYANTEIDFIIPSPTTEQVSELHNLEHIDRVVPYYFTQTSVNHRDSIIVNQQKIMFIDNENSMENTMFTNNRLIKKSQFSYDNPIYIDYLFNQKYGIEIDDVVSLNVSGHDVDFTVEGIYETNTIYDQGSLLAFWDGEQKATYENENSEPLNFASAIVISNDVSATKTFLIENYLPLGRLKDRTDFNDDDSYNTHVENFYNSSFESEIRVFSDSYSILLSELEQLNSNSLTYRVFMITFTLIGILSLNCIVFLLPSEKNYFKAMFVKYRNKSDIIKYYRNSIFVETIMIMILTVLGALIINLSNQAYISHQIMLLEYSYLFIALITSSLLTFFILKTMFTKKYKK